MLREQLLGFALKTLTQAYETKERLKNNLNTETVSNYVRSVKQTALGVVEYQWQKIRSRSSEAGSINGSSKIASSSTNGATGKSKKPRKSSIKPAKEICSIKADTILNMLKSDGSRLVKREDTLDGKTSLAYLIWALGHAERANIGDGISVHDVSALLYRACAIELYPINISRVVYGNATLVRQVGQQKRTKTYLLTKEGAALFKKNFM